MAVNPFGSLGKPGLRTPYAIAPIYKRFPSAQRFLCLCAFLFVVFVVLRIVTFLDTLEPKVEGSREILKIHLVRNPLSV